MYKKRRPLNACAMCVLEVRKVHEKWRNQWSKERARQRHWIIFYTTYLFIFWLGSSFIYIFFCYDIIYFLSSNCSYRTWLYIIIFILFSNPLNWNFHLLVSFNIRIFVRLLDLTHSVFIDKRNNELITRRTRWLGIVKKPPANNGLKVER